MSSSRKRATYYVSSEDGYWFLHNGKVGLIENHDWQIGAYSCKHVYSKRQLRKVLMQLKNAGCKAGRVTHLFYKREHGNFVAYVRSYYYHLEYYP